MNYLFYDLEYATSFGGVKVICEFGYVLTNDRLEVLERDNFVINPQIYYKDWDQYVLQNILHRQVSDYEQYPEFRRYYDEIKKLFERADVIVGHSIAGDAQALNDALERYELDDIAYVMYDVKPMFRMIMEAPKDVSVSGMLELLEIEGEEGAHDAETDAYNTMLVYKALLAKSGEPVEAIIEKCPGMVDSTSELKVKSIEETQKKREQELRLLADGVQNTEFEGLSKKTQRDFVYRVQRGFIQRVKPHDTGLGRLKGEKVCFGKAFEQDHFYDYLKLVQIISDEGGRVVTGAGETSLFVKYDTFDEEGNVKRCARLEYVNAEIEKGRKIRIVSPDELYEMVGHTADTLHELPPVSLEVFVDEILNYKEREERMKYLKRLSKESENSGSTLGDMFGDIFKKIK